MMAKAGDRIRVNTVEETFEGILMPRPELLDKGFIVLKLDSGYNIGISSRRIKKTELISGFQPHKVRQVKRKADPKLAWVSILSSGGTISSKVDYRTGGTYADYTAKDFVKMCPELENVANIRASKIISIMSEDIGFKEWQILAKAIVAEHNRKEVAGVVVTMGTDSLHVTAAALSFMISNSGKPIIITGSQRSIDRGSSDAFMNLICSVNAAARFDYSGVATCLHGTINDDFCILIKGTKVRKMHTSRRDSFRPVNCLPLAKVWPDGRITDTIASIDRRKESVAEFDGKYDQKAGLVYVHPGIKPDIIDHYVKNGYKGLVIAGTALGHVPTNGKNSLYEPIRKAIAEGIAIVITSQTLYGRTHPYVYTNLRKLSLELGCIFAEDMLPEVAFVKLSWALARKKGLKEIKELMLTDIAGEISQRIDAASFLY